MVENVITSKLEIQGYENIKQIKDEITKLRAQMKELTTGTEEYKTTADKLVQTEYELKNAMSNARKDNSALKGSYNDLANQMSALKKVWKETTDEAVRAEYGQQINDLNTQLKALDATTGNFQRNVGDYKNQLKLAKQELAQLTEGTQAYNDKLAECAELTHKLKDQQQLIKNSALDLGDQLENITGIASSMVAGFSALKAAMGLFGKESEDVQKAMLKVQQMMAIVQGLKGMEGLFKKTQYLSKALLTLKQKIIDETIVVGINTTAVKQNATAEELAAAGSLKNATAKGTEAVATGGLTKAIKALNTAIKANPALVIITLLTTAIALVPKLTDSVKKLFGARKEAEKLERERMQKSADAAKQQIELNEALQGSEWKFTEEGKKAYGEYFDYLRRATEENTEERHKMLLEFFNWQREMREKREAEEKAAEEARLDALNKYIEAFKSATQEFESLITSNLQTTTEKYFDEYTGVINQWNSYIQKLPKELSSKFTFNANDLKQAYEMFRGQLVEPIIETVSENSTQLTDKSIHNIEVAYGRLYGFLKNEFIQKVYNETEKAITERENLREKEISFMVGTNKYEMGLYKTKAEFEIKQEEEVFNSRNAFYDKAIEDLQDERAKLESMLSYGSIKDTQTYLSVYDDLIKQYEDKQKVEKVQSAKNISKLTAEIYQEGLREQQQDLELQLKTNKQIYETYASSTNDLWFKGGTDWDVYKEYLADTQQYEEEYYQRMIENMQKALEDEKLLDEEKMALKEELTRVQMEYDDILVQHEIENNDLREQSFLRTYKTIQDSIKATSTIMGDWGDYYADIIDDKVKNEKMSNKEAAKQYKVVQGIQAAQTMVNSLDAAMGAYSSLASIPYVGPALGIAAAASTLAFGIAKVRQIQNTNPYNVDSSNNDSNSPAVATPVIQDYNPAVFQNLTGQLETEQLANAMENRPLWVSVTDVDRVQNQVKVKDQETTF